MSEAVTLPFIRCVTCGSVLGGKLNKFERLVGAGLHPGEALNQLGLYRACCRINTINPIVIPTLESEQPYGSLAEGPMEEYQRSLIERTRNLSIVEPEETTTQGALGMINASSATVPSERPPRIYRSDLTPSRERDLATFYPAAKCVRIAPKISTTPKVVEVATVSPTTPPTVPLTVPSISSTSTFTTSPIPSSLPVPRIQQGPPITTVSTTGVVKTTPMLAPLVPQPIVPRQPTYQPPTTNQSQSDVYQPPPEVFQPAFGTPAPEPSLPGIPLPSIEPLPPASVDVDDLPSLPSLTQIDL